MTDLRNVDPHEKSAQCHFDWLTCVFTITSCDVDDISRLYYDLGLDLIPNHASMKNGIYTYEEAYSLLSNTIIVGIKRDFMANETEVMVQISGQGLESFEAYLNNAGRSLYGFIQQCFKWNGKFTRIDACTDFFNYPDQFSPKWLHEVAYNGGLITSAKRCKLILDYPSTGGNLGDYSSAQEGATLYVGRNPKQLRIYNKLAERSAKVGIDYLLDSWYRWEFQLNHEQAVLFMNEFKENDFDLSQTWIDWLASNYRFVEQIGHQEKRSRYPNFAWYDDLIKDHQKKIKVNRVQQKPTLARATKWIGKQVIPTLTTIFETRRQGFIRNGVDPETAYELAKKIIFKDIDEALNDDRVNEQLVDSWLEENNISRF